MKSPIRLSRYSAVLTVVLFLVIYGLCIATLHEKAVLFIVVAVFITLILSALLYGTAYVRVDDNRVILGSPLRSKIIPVRDIVSVERFQPTMGSIRLWGSGGFLGYWGIFREGDIGRYYAFYGKSSDCFLIRMKNGDKYVVGCKNPDKIVEFIKNRI